MIKKLSLVYEAEVWTMVCVVFKQWAPGWRSSDNDVEDSLNIR